MSPNFLQERPAEFQNPPGRPCFDWKFTLDIVHDLHAQQTHTEAALQKYNEPPDHQPHRVTTDITLRSHFRRREQVILIFK
jgi:hypothetical protein